MAGHPCRITVNWVFRQLGASEGGNFLLRISRQDAARACCSGPSACELGTGLISRPGSGFGPRAGARGAPQHRPILRLRRWRLSLGSQALATVETFYSTSSRGAAAGPHACRTDPAGRRRAAGRLRLVRLEASDPVVRRLVSVVAHRLRAARRRNCGVQPGEVRSWRPALESTLSSWAPPNPT